MPDGTIGVPDPLARDGQGSEGAPNAGTGGQGDFDYQRAYNELRPVYTQATQEASQYRDRLSEYESLFEALHDPDPEVQAQAMDALGLEPVAGSDPAGHTDDEDFVDPLEKDVLSLREEVEQLRAAREQEEEASQVQEIEQLRDEYIGEAIGLIEQSRSEEGGKPFTFTQREEEVLGNLAIALTGDDGVPDVRAAYTALYGDDGVLEANRTRWIDSKESAHQAPLGTSIPAEQRPKTARERVAYADERWARLVDQQ